MQLPRSLDEQRAMMTFGMVEPLPADRRPKPIGAFVTTNPARANRGATALWKHERQYPGIGTIRGRTATNTSPPYAREITGATWIPIRGTGASTK